MLVASVQGGPGVAAQYEGPVGLSYKDGVCSCFSGMTSSAQLQQFMMLTFLSRAAQSYYTFL